MFKTSAKKRAAVRRSKAKHRRTPQEKAREKIYQREYRRKNAHRKNEQRNARRDRHRRNEYLARSELRERFAGMSITNSENVRVDATRWQGPGAAREQKLSRLADEILRKNATASKRKSRDARLPAQRASHDKIAPPTFRERLVSEWVRRMRL